MLSTSSRNEGPSNNDGVRRTTKPSGVLALWAPPPDPIRPSHSASWPTMYTTLNTVANTADQNPTAFVDEGILVFIIRLCVAHTKRTITATGNRPCNVADSDAFDRRLAIHVRKRENSRGVGEKFPAVRLGSVAGRAAAR